MRAVVIIKTKHFNYQVFTASDRVWDAVRKIVTERRDDCEDDCEDVKTIEV